MAEHDCTFSALTPSCQNDDDDVDDDVFLFVCLFVCLLVALAALIRLKKH